MTNEKDGGAERTAPPSRMDRCDLPAEVAPVVAPAIAPAVVPVAAVAAFDITAAAATGRALAAAHAAGIVDDDLDRGRSAAARTARTAGTGAGAALALTLVATCLRTAALHVFGLLLVLLQLFVGHVKERALPATNDCHGILPLPHAPKGHSSGKLFALAGRALGP